MYRTMVVLFFGMMALSLQAKAWTPTSTSKPRPTHNTCETAISLSATSEELGLAEERDWTSLHYSGWQWERQEIYTCPHFKADKITLHHSSGNQVVVLFNTSSFYGKW